MIIFNNVLPFPIPQSDCEKSYIWGKNNISFNTEEFTLIKSSSGKGKTTLLSIIYNIRYDYSGSVIFNENDIKYFSSRERSDIRQNKLSYLFQGLNLFDDLTGYENIELNNKLTNFKTKDEVMAIAKTLEVDKYMDKFVRRLSFGQKQRIALIRALCQPYEYLLLDEPFSHLDKDNQEIACQLITDECKKNKAGLILTSLGNEYFLKYDKIYEI